MSEKGEIYWVPDDEEVWTLGSKSSGELPNGCINFLLHKDKRIVAVPRDRCLLASDSNNNPEDMVFLQDVNEATILSCTRERFKTRKIYTSVGLVLMSINPFELIPGLYGGKMIEKYRYSYAETLPAHVYSIPSRAFYNMCQVGGNQSILISGESGAGKTEATKQCLSFLTEVASREETENKGNGETNYSISVSDVANRIISASPVLESFGNAKTIRNPNSSRFGKWMVLNFDQNNMIHSSNIDSYLLEKSRVTNRDIKERNYHIFYQLLRGEDPNQLAKWFLLPDTSIYNYVYQDNGNGETEDFDDAATYKKTLEAFQKMGFSVEQISDILKVVAAIILLGNISFVPMKDGEACEIAEGYLVDQTADLLTVDPDKLSYSLCNRSIESGKQRKSIITIELNPQKAADTRDTLARQTYDRLFQEIVSIINQNSKQRNDKSSTDRCIGLLDIFGFEIFIENSFEQLCINYCNEMLQNHFNFVIFTTERNLYLTEGIKCDTIEFRDNSDVILEIEKVFKTLDEEGRIPRGTSKTWYDKMKRNVKFNYVTFKNRRTGNVFIVKHYAGDVDYQPLLFLDKNVETVNNDLNTAMLSSGDQFIHVLFAPTAPPATVVELGTPKRLSTSKSSPNLTSIGDSPRSSRRASTNSTILTKSISWRFSHQLNTLLAMLKKTESHFIRCIKSNEQCLPQIFTSKIVHKQLLYSGVFEVVKIQQSGLPCRLSHNEFIRRYRCLLPSSLRYNINSPRDMIKCLSHEGFQLPMAQVGVTMTFLKSQEQRFVEISREKLLHRSSTRIACWLQMVCCRSVYIPFLYYFREFSNYETQLQLEPSQQAYQGLLTHSTAFEQLLRCRVVQHVVDRCKKSLDCLAEKVLLVEDGRNRLNNRTEEGILSLQEIVSRAIDLEMTKNDVVLECKDTVQKYFKSLEFVTLVDTPGTLLNLSAQNLNEGIDMISRFLDILPDGQSTIDKVLNHKRIVDQEMETVLKPMQRLLTQSSIKFDRKTGNLVPFWPDGDKYIKTLKDMINQYEGVVFNCQDAFEIYTDCKNFLKILDDYVPFFDAVGAIDFMNSASCRSENELFNGQIEEIKQWADIQMSSLKLKNHLAIGIVPKTAKGSEEPVQVREVQALVDKLEMLLDPSPLVESVIRVGSWIVRLRKAVLNEDWELLERTVIGADKDGVENSIFDDYPECIEELNNCQWQVIYHGLMADVLFVLSETCFREISLASENWVHIVKTLPDNMVLLQTVQTFVEDEASPRLTGLIHVLENILQLRSLMYEQEIDLAKALVSSIRENHKNVLMEQNVLEHVEAELAACEQMILMVECEEDLDHAIEFKPAEVYQMCDSEDQIPKAINEQRPYAVSCDLSKSAEELSTAIKALEALGDNFHPTLQEKLNLCKNLVKARFLLVKAEKEFEIDWALELEQFEDDVATSLNGSNFMPDFMIEEYENIVHELTRRHLLKNFNLLLSATCTFGTIDVDVHVNESLLVAQFVKFNELSSFMKPFFEFLPVNLQALSLFTNNILKMRKSVLEGLWDNSMNMILDKIGKMDHGGGFLVLGVKEEIEMVKAEKAARDAISTLRKELETLKIKIPDNEETIGSHQPKAEVELTPLKDAVEGIKDNLGDHSKKLYKLGVCVIELLELLMAGDSNAMDPLKATAAADQYRELLLDATSAGAVFKYIRVHNFLKNLCEVINPPATSETTAKMLLDGINNVKTSIKQVPVRFIPWLKASYLYVEVIDSYAKKDWVSIVNCTRKLEDCVDKLNGVVLSENKGDNEQYFVEVLRDKVVSGYRKALAVKEQEERQREVEEKLKMTPEDTLKAEIRKQDENNPYGITHLRVAGYSDQEILKMKFPMRTLWAFDFDPVLLRREHYSAAKMLIVGFSVAALYYAGYRVEALRDAGCSVSELRAAGVSFDQLRLAGFEEKEILKSGIPVDFLKTAEYDASKLTRMGIALKELITAGFSALELRAAGFTAIELKLAGLNDVNQLYTAGYDLKDLKSCFDANELASAGFGFKELRAVGVEDFELFNVGFEVDLEMEALIDFFHLTNGPKWKVRLHWCTAAPLREWFGLRCEPDVNGNDRVTGIDLSDNHLIGPIPEKLWLLSKLQTLRLGMNFLRGDVPPKLVKRIIDNNIITDLSLPEINGYKPIAASPTKLKNPFISPIRGHSISAASPALDMSTLSFDANPVHEYGIRSFPAFGGENIEDVERVTLMDLYRSCRGNQWVKKENWGSSRPLKEWYGVTVNKFNQVVKLVLPSNNLRGGIPNTLYFLEELVELDFRLNQLSGPIPETIGNCKYLKNVYLQSNRLSGVLPDSIGNLVGLNIFDVRSNQFSDELPGSIRNLKMLRYLGLRSNKLKFDKNHLKDIMPWCKIAV